MLRAAMVRLRDWLAGAPGHAPTVSGQRTAPPARVVNPVTCPRCGAVVPEVMEEDVCVIFIYCAACHDRIDMKPGDCCVFRSYGQNPCFHPARSSPPGG